MASQAFITFDFSSNDQRFYNLLKQLRPNLTPEGFQQIFSKAQETNGYKIIGMEINKELVALIGFRILYDFVHGKHLYIDDLITSLNHQSKGYGAVLLKYAENIAKENGCSNLRLCTGIENERGKQFYEKNSWNIRAIVFKKKL